VELALHPAYEQLIDRARHSHARHRSPAEISAEDVTRARLYCYAFRKHTIGAFDATRKALERMAPAGAAAESWRTRAEEALADAANLAMEPVPADFRAVVATLYRYHQCVQRAIDSLRREAALGDGRVEAVGDRFVEILSAITASPGIDLAQDTHAPEQASFIVPGLGIVIVPLVYGDHHSWNLAWLGEEHRHVPTHRHHHGVEIHLGFNPTHGLTVLGKHRARVDEGYAMPIPPDTDHGWVNTADEIHHVPFVFGSLRHGGWGVFLDVVPQPRPVEAFTALVERDSPPFKQMIYLERHIAQAAAAGASRRQVLIPHTVTNRGGSGGLELAITRVVHGSHAYALDSFRIVSIVRGGGTAEIEGIRREVKAHDHFGIPAGMRGTLRAGPGGLVALDALIRPPGYTGT
jgi:hypothetical protein